MNPAEPNPSTPPRKPSAPAPARSSNERRSGDRRRRSTPMVSRYTFFGGRRRMDRRDPRTENQYVDRYSPKLAAILVTVAVLCALDAVFTLLYLQKGGQEANPVMAEVINWGPRIFIAIKCTVTNLGLVVLCLHKNFRYVKPVIAMIFAIYAVLFLYHLYLATVIT